MLRGGSGIVCTKFERKDRHDNQIKPKQISPPIRRQKRNSSTQDSFLGFIDKEIGYHIFKFLPLLHNSSCHEANKKRRKRTYDSLMKVS